jgi:hypothetical protein
MAYIKGQWDIASVWFNRSSFDAGTELPQGSAKLSELLADGWEPFGVSALTGDRERIYLRRWIEVEA